MPPRCPSEGRREGHGQGRSLAVLRWTRMSQPPTHVRDLWLRLPRGPREFPNPPGPRLGPAADGLCFSRCRLRGHDHGAVPAHVGPGPGPAAVLQAVPRGVPGGADDNPRAVPVHLLHSGRSPGGTRPCRGFGGTPLLPFLQPLGRPVTSCSLMSPSPGSESARSLSGFRSRGLLVPMRPSDGM